MAEHFLNDLRALAHHVDPQFHPTLNELPGLFAALVAKTNLGAELEQAITAGQDRQKELHPAEVQGNEVRTSVAGVLSPPVEGADTSGQQGGVSQARYDALAAEVDKLRAGLDQLSGHIPTPDQTGAPQASTPPVASSPPPAVEPPAAPVPDAPAEPDNARELELNAEIEQLRAQLAQREALDTATGQHPTASSEPA